MRSEQPEPPVLILLACSDDYLLEESLQEATATVCGELGDVEPEVLGERTTPEQVAIEVSSPSLFAAQRVLVVPDIRTWLSAPAPAGASGHSSAADVTPLVATLRDGLPPDTGLVLGAWCGGQPKGPLVDLVKQHGRFSWIALPPPPKPWEDVALSDEQRSLLRGVVLRAAPGVKLSKPAADLLLERLGFAPRLLAQEIRKLVTAAGEGQRIEEELVRQLIFPKERSLEVIRDAVLERDGTTLLDLVGAAGAGLPLCDWRGQRLDGSSLPTVLLAQVGNLLQQLLYLSRLAVNAGIAGEMAPRKTAARGWYSKVFKARLAGELEQRITADEASPLRRSSGPPSPWTLSQLFAAAGRYRQAELISALADAGQVEAAVRGPLGLEAVSAWLANLFLPPASRPATATR